MSEEITFENVVHLAWPAVVLERVKLFSVIYTHAQMLPKSNGALLPGQRVKVVDGMEFDCVVTSNA